MEWPASSPDLNPIEHLWDQLGHAVHARVTNTTTSADLRQMLVEEWDAIPQQCVTRLVTSMRKRCQAVSVYGAAVGWHPILQPAFVASQPTWLCWSLWHEQHAQADPTSVQ